MKALTKKQKAVLAQAANRAFRALVTCGYPGMDDINAWRREQQLEATGIASMTGMDQRHYVPLLNHFNALAGRAQVADTTWSDKDKAMFRLRDAMARHEIDARYLTAIVVDQLGERFRGYAPAMMLEALKAKATVQEIINLSYTVINRGRAKTRNINAAHDIDPDDITEPHAHQSTVPPGGLEHHFNVINAQNNK